MVLDLGLKLYSAGQNLELHQPKDVLLSSLREVENCLSVVDQSDSEIFLWAMKPSMTSLVRSELMRYLDKYVRLTVTSCVILITGITAPKHPFNSNIMKEIFQLIVESFQGLDDIRSPFAKRVTILKIVAKIKACVIMLDLDCEDLILKMFQHFVDTTSENHAKNVIISILTIMTLTLNESDDISQQLLSILLAGLRQEQNISPAAQVLVTNVVKQCEEKLRPHLTVEHEEEESSKSEISEVVKEPEIENKDHSEHACEEVVFQNDSMERYVLEENADFCIDSNNNSLSLHDSGFHEGDWKKQLWVTDENEVQVLT
ncbi:hypothetical protein KI387_027858, partial [Taxus chinensis]